MFPDEFYMSPVEFDCLKNTETCRNNQKIKCEKKIEIIFLTIKKNYLSLETNEKFFTLPNQLYIVLVTILWGPRRCPEFYILVDS